MLTKLIEKLKAENTRLVFPEGNDLRILQACSRLKKDGILDPILLGNVEEVTKIANDNYIDITNIEIIDPLNFARFDEMVKLLVELRRGKMTEEKAIASCKQSNYFGTMLVKMGLADGLLGGATYSTADTVRPALQIIKTKPEAKLVSSCFILTKEENGELIKYVMSDCAINIDPSAEDLVEITMETANTAKIFDIKPVVALLSYSTLGSGKGASVDKVRTAAELIKAKDPDFLVDGELQFDAAFSNTVAAVKAPKSQVAGHANTFIFPNINAGNIGYKIAQRLGGYQAIGPILQGLNAPINDLSRGCDANEVYKMAIITAGLK